jgi:hypothetical protein
VDKVATTAGSTDIASAVWDYLQLELLRVGLVARASLDAGLATFLVGTSLAFGAESLVTKLLESVGRFHLQASHRDSGAGVAGGMARLIRLVLPKVDLYPAPAEPCYARLVGALEARDAHAVSQRLDDLSQYRVEALRVGPSILATNPFAVLPVEALLVRRVVRASGIDWAGPTASYWAGRWPQFELSTVASYQRNDQLERLARFVHRA